MPSSTTERADRPVAPRAPTDDDVRLPLAPPVATAPHARLSRLDALDHEWSAERTLDLVLGAFALGGALLGARVDRRFHALSAVAGGCLALQAATGWSPVVPVLRQLGVRTAAEIDAERRALRDEAQRAELYVAENDGAAGGATRAALDAFEAIDSLEVEDEDIVEIVTIVSFETHP